MASRYHWITTTIGQPNFTGSTTLPQCDLVLPAGAQLKKFLIKDNLFTGISSGASINFLNNLTARRIVKFTAGPFLNRVVYSDFRRMHSDYLVFFDTTQGPGTNRVYATILNSCDEDLFVDQKCVYGKAAGPTQTLSLLGSVQPHGFVPGNFTGSASYVFSALYYL